MSANLDLVRSIYADLERGDWSRVFQMASDRWPEFELVIADGPLAGSFTGVAEAEGSFYSMLAAWEEIRFEVEEYRVLDDERVLVLEHRKARGKGSGVETGTKAAGVVHLRDGKVTRLVVYYDRNRALADLGLAPEDDAP
jgi:ketosteroid isomerase-like protein